MRICFVLVPTTVSLIIGCYFMIKTMITLIKIKIINKSQQNLSRNKNKKVEHIIIRIGIHIFIKLFDNN